MKRRGLSSQTEMLTVRYARAETENEHGYNPKALPKDVNVHTLSNTDFHALCVEKTSLVYGDHFGAPVTLELVRADNIVYLLWIEDENGVSVGAMMVKNYPDYHKKYRICGLAVAEEHRKRGLGTQLMLKLKLVLPNDAELLLGIDNDTDSTNWLQGWYKKLGFEVLWHFSTEEETIMVDEVRREDT